MSLVKPVIYDGGFQRQVQQGDVVGSAESATTLATVGAGTLTAAVLCSNLFTRTGPTAAFTDTTDTAANIIAALANGSGVAVQSGSSYRFKYLNTVGFPCTFAAGTNVVLSGNCVVPPLSTNDFLITITNGTPGSVVPATTTNTSAVIAGMTAAQTALITYGMAVTGTGIPASTTVIGVQPGIGVTLSANATATGTNAALTFAPIVTIQDLTQEVSLPDFKYTAITANTSTLSAGDMTGAVSCTLNCSGQATPTLTTRTADQMIADIPNAQIGLTWSVKVLNRNSGTQTMAGGTGVTITGTATLATVTWKEFICTYTAASTITMQVGASALL